MCLQPLITQVAAPSVGILWPGPLGVCWPTRELALDCVLPGGLAERAVGVLGDAAQAGPRLERVCR